ncbi:MAG: LysM peptidoglycan-binding domain-containing protein [Clostridia bacterium]|nr:LysM peptidoglycan-binding domain-containing protein [Clostridia bacterium]
MRKHVFHLAVCVCLVAALLSGIGSAAFAASDYFTVTLQKGDTVYSLCKANGLDYEKEKNAIMVLNGMDLESQLSFLRAGDTIRLPSKVSTAPTQNVISSADKVEYYVIPYVIEKGDTIAHVYWLWGLRFENYVEDIKSLNGVENLDLLYVGAIYLLPTTAENLKTDVYTTVMSHVMQHGETAYDIITGYGVDYYKNLAKLESYNGGKDLAKISAGEKLLIPLV